MQKGKEMTPRMMDILVAITQGDVRQSQCLTTATFRKKWQHMDASRKREINVKLREIDYLEFSKYMNDEKGEITLDNELIDLFNAIDKGDLSRSTNVQRHDKIQQQQANNKLMLKKQNKKKLQKNRDNYKKKKIAFLIQN